MVSEQSTILEEWLDGEVRELVSTLGGTVASTEVLTTLQSERKTRASFKLILTDGRAFKARLHMSADSRLRVSRLWPLLTGMPFAGIAAARGRSTIEEWIEGMPLKATTVTEDQACRAGALLGQLHTRSGIPADLLSTAPGVEDHLQQISRYLAAFAAAQPEHSSLCASLVDLAVQHRPANVELALILEDFSAENIVVSEQGSLIVIDNEHLQVGTPEYDLARCRCRWPMNATQMTAFNGGYQQFRCLQPFGENWQFWAISALSLSLHVHLTHGKINRPVLNALERLVQGETKQVWP